MPLSHIFTTHKRSCSSKTLSRQHHFLRRAWPLESIHFVIRSSFCKIRRTVWYDGSFESFRADKDHVVTFLIFGRPPVTPLARQLRRISCFCDQVRRVYLFMVGVTRTFRPGIPPFHAVGDGDFYCIPNLLHSPILVQSVASILHSTISTAGEMLNQFERVVCNTLNYIRNRCEGRTKTAS